MWVCEGVILGGKDITKKDLFDILGLEARSSFEGGWE